MATSPRRLLTACRGMFPMPPKPGFLLQGAWDAMALRPRAVGEMGLTEGLNRPGGRVYNRWRLLRAAGARPGAQVWCRSAERPEGPRREGGPQLQACPKAPKTTNACAEQSAMLSRRANGPLRFNGFCEDGSRALLEAKKRAAAPEATNPWANMVLDPAPEESGQRCGQAGRVAQSEARRKAIGSSSGGGGAQLWSARGGAGKRAASTQTAEGARQRHCHHKSSEPRSAHLAALASEAGRVAKGMRTEPGWGQRMPIMRRLGEFTKKHGLEMSEEHVPLFIVSLNPAKSSAVQHTRALLSLMAGGKAPPWMFLSGLRRAAAYPTRQVRPMMRWGLGLVCAALLCGSRGSQRVAGAKLRCCRRKTLSSTRATATPLLSTGRFAKNTRGRRAQSSALRGDRGCGLQHSEKSDFQSDGWGRARRTWFARGGKNHGALRHDGALNKAGPACPRCRGGDRTGLWLENSDAAGEARGSAGTAAPHRAVSGTLGRHLDSAKPVGLMKGTRGVWPSRLVRPRRARAELRRQGRFLMRAAFRDALG
ncbi:hypothetical protein ERJ75_000735500 [Trypanosoma vivax]|nr:hypothetical protein ERJ75_000735200 [Trypanosoma vivax]KAH8614263.1 hypothetical protein ERJ75_000735500 [Trypanosoma vivax]